MKLASPLLLLIVLMFTTSCANYINQMHQEFDRADGVEAPVPRSDKFAMYRGGQTPEGNRIPRKKAMINSENNPYVVPAVKRNYENPEAPKKRYKADDLADSRGDGSLWSGVEGRNNFLFTENDKKQNGDIILIQVAGKLKNEITAELKRAFPAPRKPAKEEGESKKEEKPAAAAASPASPQDDKVDASSDKVYDRISSVVIEEINEDHLLLRGRKNVLYHNRKRVIEVQALIARRDIAVDDTVNSNRILESQVAIIR